MDKDIRANWERFLDPTVLRTNLILASVYIAAFEVLKNSIIEQIRDFYTTGFDENGWIISSKYKDDVLSKDRSLTFASIKWLKENEVIDDEDIEKFNKIKECRNLLAHEITKMLTEGLPPNFAELFNNMVELVNKIDCWWIINVEIPTDPNLIDRVAEIDLSGIIPGRTMSLKMMIDVALGSDESANFYINEFKKNINGN